MQKKTFIATGVVIGLAITLSACDLGGKISEPFNDAKRAGEDNSAALIITMPDGFSNQATKCVAGIRYTSAFKGDATYGSISVVGGDNGCKK